MKAAVYPGSFDPVTNGHLDIIYRASKVFDEIRVVIMINSAKRYTFSVEERLEMLREAVKDFPGKVIVESHDGLLVDYCRSVETYTVIRGLRALTDFEGEFQMAVLNRKLEPKVESVLFVTSTEFSYVSSSAVRELASYGGDLCNMVPEHVRLALEEKFKDDPHRKHS